MGTKERTIVIGHKNPDTDSICSAICYAHLKHLMTGKEYVAGRAGQISSETEYVLEYFGAEPPVEIESVKTQVKDIEIRETKGVAKNISLKKAWNLMQDSGVVTLPAITEDSILEGLITVGDITRSYMNVTDSSILSKAHTQYSNIIETINGEIVVGDASDYFTQGKVLIAAANPDRMESYIQEHDLVILGNRYESQLCAIEMGASVIIVCDGASVSMTIKKLAQEKGCAVITTPYDTYLVARLINQSMPISYFMKTENLIGFDADDHIDDVKDVMASKRHRDFPVLDKDGKYQGMMSRRNLLGARGKNLILVDHNERSQAVDGMEMANIVEIIDHHRLGTVQTMSPVFFRNQPLGCTATIIYQIYQENNIEIEKKYAGLLCSAIISDTLLFRSPTCTAVDKAAALHLAEIAGVNVEELADGMFAAGSKLKGKSDAEIFYQDFKKFSAGKLNFGIGQITSLNAEELKKLGDRMLPFMEASRESEGVDLMFFMLTNILTESTELVCVGHGALQLIGTAFHLNISKEEEERQRVELAGVVSRKKQLAPSIMIAVEQ